MGSNSQNEVMLSVLNTQHFSNKIKTLKEFCEEVIAEKAFGVLIKDNRYLFGVREVKIKDSAPFLHCQVANKILQDLMFKKYYDVNALLRGFSDSSKCSLDRISVKYYQVDYSYLDMLLTTQQNNITHVKLSHCKIASCGSNHLLSLCKSNTRLFCLESTYITLTVKPSLKSFYDLSATNFPNLRSLRLSAVPVAWSVLVNKFDPPKLNTIEISNYYEGWFSELPTETVKLAQNNIHEEIFFEEPSEYNYEKLTMEEVNTTFKNPILQLYRLCQMKLTLQHLILHNIVLGKLDFDQIFQLKNLIHLDISMSVSIQQKHNTRPDVSLYNIVENLPKLKSLDVSSTSIGDDIEKDIEQVGHSSFWNLWSHRKLEFLGLLNCNGAGYQGIYSIAKQVSGDATVPQVLLTFERSHNRLNNIVFASRRLYMNSVDSSPVLVVKCMKILLEVCYHNKHTKKLELLTSLVQNFIVNMYGIMRTDSKIFNQFQKREILRFLVSIFSIDNENKIFKLIDDEERLKRIALLSLEHFNYPEDAGVDFNYLIGELMKLLVAESESQIGRISIHICNWIACQPADRDVKQAITSTTFIQSVVEVIKMKLTLKKCDDVMILCWGVLWNISDETPQNCQKFVEIGGLKIMMKCFEVFERDELRKSAIGLVGNIAEVHYLRDYFMDPNIIKLLIDWATSHPGSNDIELSYHACGTLSHLLSDPGRIWFFPKQQVAMAVQQAVDSWDINARRHINYRSFLPILGLVHCGVKEAAHWAVWALCNLVKFDGDYKRILERENAIEILERITPENFLSQTLVNAKEVIRMLLQNYRQPDNFQIGEDVI